MNGTCLYVTGSYGRLEASKFSDLDLFFVRDSTRQSNPISHVEKTLVDAAIIKICRRLELPEFSGGGEYLQIHYLDEIVESLGSQEDDYKNHFTARMLLILESQPLFDDEPHAR